MLPTPPGCDLADTCATSLLDSVDRAFFRYEPMTATVRPQERVGSFDELSGEMR